MSEKLDFGGLIERQEALRLQFVMSELGLAITFCQLAGNTENREKAGRNTHNARRAYDAATHALQQGVGLKSADREEVDGKLMELREMLDYLEWHQEPGKTPEDSR